MRVLMMVASVALILATPARAAPFEGSDNYKAHLEFLGYSVTEKGKTLLAKHSKQFNVFVRAYHGGVMVSGFFGSTEQAKTERLAFLEFLNEMNRTSIAARYYADKDNDVILEAWYPGAYEKTRFGMFFDKFNLLRDQLQKSGGARVYLQ
jgi:hypothetical protein